MAKRLHETISRAFELRKKFINQTDTNAYRLVHSYGDALPEITIDIYDKNILVQYFKPCENTTKDEMYEILNEFFTPENITEKIRLKDADIKTHNISGSEAPRRFCVTENNIKFNVSFQAGGSTGLFLDQRDNRKKIKTIAKGAEVLNCFCYTSSFSIYAGLGGAVKTVNIDLSRKAIEWSKENILLNNLDINKHDFIVGDVWDMLKLFKKKGRFFDLIIMDPPSFSTSKKRALSVEQDIPELVGSGLEILRPDGIFAFSTNIAKMNFSRFFQLLSLSKNFTKKPFKLIDLSSQGIDFPTDGIHFKEPYLKFVLLTH
jgi:23S rRNA (cytosine1962-C5)-methyltransferase